MNCIDKVWIRFERTIVDSMFAGTVVHRPLGNCGMWESYVNSLSHSISEQLSRQRPAIVIVPQVQCVSLIEVYFCHFSQLCRWIRWLKKKNRKLTNTASEKIGCCCEFTIMTSWYIRWQFKSINFSLNGILVIVFRPLNVFALSSQAILTVEKWYLYSEVSILLHFVNKSNRINETNKSPSAHSSTCRMLLTAWKFESIENHKQNNFD